VVGFGLWLFLLHVGEEVFAGLVEIVLLGSGSAISFRFMSHPPLCKVSCLLKLNFIWVDHRFTVLVFQELVVLVLVRSLSVEVNLVNLVQVLAAVVDIIIVSLKSLPHHLVV